MRSSLGNRSIITARVATLGEQFGTVNDNHAARGYAFQEVRQRRNIALRNICPLNMTFPHNAFRIARSMPTAFFSAEMRHFLHGPKFELRMTCRGMERNAAKVAIARSCASASSSCSAIFRRNRCEQRSQ